MASNLLYQAPIVRLPVFSDPSSVQTVVGRKSSVSDDIDEFRGIPYAHVPARWEHCLLRDRLPRDIFDATENGPKCPAPADDTRVFQSYLPFPTVRQDEFECLNLLIVRPSESALARQGLDADANGLPVMVWLHGGGFIGGAGTDPVWDPARLTSRALFQKRPFIAVSINYRLGIFGFSGSSDVIAAQSSDTPINGLNFGLYDQKVALKWVQRNIAAFGGDATKVTIMGHSAGGICSYLHLLEAELSHNVPSKTPLFRKAGVLSGPVGGLDLTTLEKADRRWMNLCQFWSVTAETPVQRLERLRRIPAKDLLESASDLGWKLYMLIVDELTIRSSSLRCGVSVHLAQNDLGAELRTDEHNPPNNPIEIMISAADEEFRGFAMAANYDYASFKSVLARSYPPEETLAAMEVLERYNILPESTPEELFEALSQFFSDSTMMHKVYRAYTFFTARRREQASLAGRDPAHVGVQLWHYNMGNPFQGPMYGIAHHGVELVYGFGNFDDALDKVDRGAVHGYEVPTEEPLSAAPGQSNIDEPSPHATAKDTITEDRLSNLDLSRQIQDKWIEFIFEDSTATHAADDVVTFCADGSLTVESWSTSEKWTSKREKLDVLDQNAAFMTDATQKLVGGVLGMDL